MPIITEQNFEQEADLLCGLCNAAKPEYEITFERAWVLACAKCTKKKTGSLPD